MTEESLSPEECLTGVTPGQKVCICRIETGEEDAVRLKRMGIHQGRHLRVMQTVVPLILQVLHIRIGLSRQLAGQIFVRSLTLDTEKPL